MHQIILTSSFGTVADELTAKKLIPEAPCRVSFIVTAGNPYRETPWITSDRSALERLGYTVEDIDLLEMHAERVSEKLSSASIVFVAGGNTSYLAKAAKNSGFCDVAKRFLERGGTYIGSSAGSILAGPSVAPFLEEDNQEIGSHISLKETRCLGIVPYVVLPHYPGYAVQNDAIESLFKENFSFAKLTDNEYRSEQFS